MGVVRVVESLNGIAGERDGRPLDLGRHVDQAIDTRREDFRRERAHLLAYARQEREYQLK
jgi:hypothetical protein